MEEIDGGNILSFLPFFTSSTDNPSGDAHRKAKISEPKPENQKINKQIKMHFIFSTVSQSVHVQLKTAECKINVFFNSTRGPFL